MARDAKAIKDLQEGEPLEYPNESLNMKGRRQVQRGIYINAF